MGGVKAVERAGQLLADGAPSCVIAGVDSLLVGLTLDAYHKAGRLLTEVNSNGFIPGEAAAAVLVGPTNSPEPRLTCRGLGYGSEPAPILSEEPLRADGLRGAIIDAFQDASATWADIDYRITDANGEQYWFKEASLALTRTMRIRKTQMDLWHPADCHRRHRSGDCPLCPRHRPPCQHEALRAGAGSLVPLLRGRTRAGRAGAAGDGATESA